MIPKKPSTHPGILADAESYVGRKLPEASTTVPDAEASKATAAAFHAMPHDPTHPAVAASYAALKHEVKAQWDHLKSRGVTFTASHEPYASSTEMREDAIKNRHLRYFPSEGGFGSDPTAAQTHPLLEKDTDGIPFNDKFRAVHDYFGHAMHGHQFGPVGEYRAYLEHAHMFTPEARGALTTETHGQNSWVNFGPHSHLPVKERPYADQKAGLLEPQHWSPLKLARVEAPPAARRMHQHLFRVASTPRQRFHGLSVGDTARQMVKEHGNGFPHVSMLAKHLGVDEGAAHESLKYLAGTGKSLGKQSMQVKLARGPKAAELKPWATALELHPDRAGPFSDWLEDHGHHHNDETLSFLRSNPASVMVAKHPKSGKVVAWAKPKVHDLESLRETRGIAGLNPDGWRGGSFIHLVQGPRGVRSIVQTETGKFLVMPHAPDSGRWDGTPGEGDAMHSSLKEATKAATREAFGA